MSIFVVNKYKHIPTENDIYIGRGSPLGNPYTSKKLSYTKAQFQCSSPEESISHFKTYLLDRIQNKDRAVCDELNRIYKQAKKGDVHLVCFCKPNCCHGDVIKEIVESKLIVKRYYAGIGSRETPIEVKEKIHTLTNILNSKNYVLRSGGADGADTFFEENSLEKEIFLPWEGFNNNKSIFHTPSKQAYEIAKKYHPTYDKLSVGGKKLMARNVHQVLGQDLNKPVDFIVCWTKNGMETGGTGQALRIAKDLSIPIYNLFHEEDYQKLLKKLGY